MPLDNRNLKKHPQDPINVADIQHFDCNSRLRAIPSRHAGATTALSTTKYISKSIDDTVGIVSSLCECSTHTHPDADIFKLLLAQHAFSTYGGQLTGLSTSFFFQQTRESATTADINYFLTRFTILSNAVLVFGSFEYPTSPICLL